MVQAVAHQLGLAGVNVVALRGNPMLTDRPLAALSLLGVKIDDGLRGAGGSVLTGAANSFAGLVEPANTVLLIDDAEALDRVSVGLVTDLRAKKRLPLLLVGGYGVHQSEWLVELVAAAQPGVSVTMVELPFEDVNQLTHGLLGSVVAADTVARIATLSGGLPGLVQALVQLNRRHGHLVRRDDIWLAEGDLFDPALHFTLAPFLRGLDRRDLDDLVQLASAPALTRPQADDLVGAGQVRGFIQRGLLRLGQLPPFADLHVFPPALAELLRRSGGQPGAAREGLLAGEPRGWPTDLTGPAAAAVADRILAHWRSQVARGWTDWDDDRVPRNAVALLVALFSRVTSDDYITMIFERTDRGPDEAALTAFVWLRAMYRALWQHDLAEAMAELDAHEAAFPALATQLRGEKCFIALTCDRVPAAETLALAAGEDPTQGEILRLTAAAAMIAQGRTRDAVDQLEAIDPGSERATILKQTLEALAQVLGEDVAAGVDLAVQRLRAAVVALDQRTISGYAYVAALGMCMLGRFDELESVVEIVYRLANTNIFQNKYQVGLFLLGSFVADWQGRHAYAHQLAAQARAVGAGIGPFPGMLARQELLFDHATTVDQLWDEVDDLLERGFVASAVYLAVAAVERVPTTTRAEAVIARAEGSQSRVLRALGRYVQIVVSQDLADFEATVDELRQACGPLDATRATITWALLLRQRGDLVGWLRRADAAWRESGRIAGPADGLFARLVEAVDLTAREIEVARHAARGRSSPEIASQIGVAIRTIETYLHSVYRKTGVNNRDELGAITRTWLTLRLEA